jgi:hypothetical protein
MSGDNDLDRLAAAGYFSSAAKLSPILPSSAAA